MKKQTKFGMDHLRLIFAFLILAIHTYPLDSINSNLDYLFTRVIFRIAVPFFLMITGFYILPKALKDIATLKKYTLKILKLYGLSILIYLPINIYNGYFKGQSLLNILKDILLNGTFYHLWYFPALILGLWLTYYLVKVLKDKSLIVLIGLYIIGLFGDSYYYLIDSIPIISSIYHGIFSVFEYTRNGLFYTPIFIYLGYTFYNKKDSIAKSKSLFYAAFFLVLMGVEGMLLKTYSLPRHTSMYIFLLPLSYFIFNSMIYSKDTSNKDLRNIANWFYILHPLFIAAVHFLGKIIHIERLLDISYINYLAVLAATISFILIVKRLKEAYTHDRRAKKRTRLFRD